MKKILIFLFFIITQFVISQEVIENPEKALNTNAGRIVMLEKVSVISDTGIGYYFESPRLPKVAPDQSIFVLDREQLLQFDPLGKFLLNYFKKGQGPGELEYVSNYFLTNDNIIIHNARPHKIVYLDYNGELVKEFRIEQAGSFMTLEAYSNNLFYFQKSGIPLVKGEPRIVDVPKNIIMVSNDGKDMQEFQSFPTKSYVAARGGARGSLGINRLITTLFNKKYLFISHIPDYQVKLFDLENNSVLRVFNRNYKRVNTPDEIKKAEKGYVILNDQKFTAPEQKYLNDIYHLLVVKDKLWVMTSTLDKEKGWLVDVYDIQGRYVDNFYLKFPEPLTYLSIRRLGHYMHITESGDFLFRLRTNEGGLVELAKYRIPKE
ncbi:MAG: 6-bladed beta-propeller [Candidatus Hodarchaeota archaeon]